MKKAIICYLDYYGNTGDPRAILLVKEGKGYENNSLTYEVVEPHSYRKQTENYAGDSRYLFILPDDAPEAVGLYSSATHYQVLKKYGQTKILRPDVVKGFDELVREDDKSTDRQWSNGLKIKPHLGFNQTELY